MSKITNPGGIRPGCIYRISLQNFVTYKEVTLFPGTGLNLIIGPNGTGKSTFVSAIILGLGGKTSAIKGKAEEIKIFVRDNNREAKIEIELYQKPKQKNVIITRVFNINNKSTWYVDNNTIDEKSVQKIISSLNIQVDNLCQLLPQERVQHFSKRTPQERLHDTLATVGAPGSIEQLKELKNLKSKQQNLDTKLRSTVKVLEELKRRNDILKRDVDEMKKRKDMEKQIEICKRKKLWCEYLELQAKVAEYKRDSDISSRKINEHEQLMAPTQRTLQRAREEIKKFEDGKQKLSTAVHLLKEQVTKSIDSVNKQEDELKHIDLSYKQKIKRYKNRIKELEDAKAELNIEEAALQQLGNVNTLKEDLNKVQAQLVSANVPVVKFRQMKQTIQTEIENEITPQIRYHQNRIHKLEDVNNKRYQCLETRYKHTYEAVKWLRENRDQFTHPVHNPMMLEINFTDQKYARYLENTVSARDLTAFTFESIDDMNRFLTHVRTVLKLNLVNAVHSRGQPPQSDDIRHISNLGFTTYLLDTIRAPDAIRSFLCTQYKIHKIPIGNQYTYNNSDKVPANINIFFTENHKFSVRQSAYSGIKSSSIVEIRHADLLANTINVKEINEAKKELKNCEENLLSKQNHLENINNKLTTVENEVRKLYGTRKIINENIEKITTQLLKIRVKKQKIDDLENDCAFDVETEKAKCKEDQKKCVIKQRKLHNELVDIMKGLQKNLMKRELYSAKLEVSRNAVVDKESELRTLESDYNKIKEVTQTINNMLGKAATIAKQKMTEIRQCCGNKLPNEPDFPDKEIFQSLPSNLEAIEEHCCELRTRMECMGAGDTQVFKEYEEQENRINVLRTDVEQSTRNNKELEDTLNKIKSKWLPSLEALVQNISRHFANMFARLKCAGEVRLIKEGEDDDFEKYGIDILVKFRAEEELSRLTGYSQSGGETALTTAVYLMSLQALTSDVPFRCVDEINQGMDAIYERRMLEMLMELTTIDGASQYFLLTPKLLTNLEYNEKTMVHTIMNGKHIMNYTQWQHEQFVRKALKYRPRLSSSS